jgi:predicted ABC-class ATPase
MAAWKVLFIMVLGFACLALALATVVVPLTTSFGETRWLWFAGLLVTTLVMSTLLMLFLKSSDRALKMETLRNRSQGY